MAQAIQSNGSGAWSSASTWVGGVVPGAGDDVEIVGSHVVTIDINPTSGTIYSLCNSLSVSTNAVLQLGYDGTDQGKQFGITGDLHCDGTISAGRNVPADNSSGDGLIYDHNSSLILNLTNATTTISGKGYLHPKHLMIQNSTTGKELLITHYNIVTDEDFLLKGSEKITTELAKYVYLNVGGTFGLAGKTYGSAPTNFSADMVVKGIIYANNVSLFTKNPNTGSALTLDTEGVITANNVNGGVAAAYSAAGGYHLTLNQRSIFRLGQGAPNPSSFPASDANFTLSNNGDIRVHYSQTLTSGTSVTSQINSFNKNDRTQVNAVKDRIGASQIGAWYHFTSDPIMEETVAKFKEWGSTAIKTTISPDANKMSDGYPFNHTWATSYDEMMNVIQEDQVDQLFADPYFTRHAFWAPAKYVNGFYKSGPDRNHERYLEVEAENYRAAKEILTRYGDLGKTYLFQNWEGDWMLRQNYAAWEDDPNTIPDDVEWEIEGMARMWRAAMRGIETAIAEFPNATSKIQYAVEFNRLYKNVGGTRQTLMDLNVPCVVADVIPKVRMHMASWSSYDGLWEENNKPFPTSFWNGMEIADYYTNSTKGLDGVAVQIGEIGINENTPFQSLTDQEITDRYAKLIAMTAKLGVQNLFIWNLYCSGAQSVALDKGVEYSSEYLYANLDGKWIFEPDESLGLVGSYIRNNYFLDINNPPTTSGVINDLTLNEGFGTYSIDFSGIFSDSDADVLTYSSEVASTSVVTASIADQEITITEVGNGVTSVTITANDGHGGEASISFNVTVQEGIEATVTLNGTSYATISAAITAANDGDIIEIRGIHTESVAIKKSITIRGLDPKRDKIQAATSSSTASSRVISISRQTGSTAEIDVTIENLGIRYGKDTENGGGISADKLDGLLTLNNLIVEHNYSDKNGGGVSIAGSNASIIGCIFQDNTSFLDGGAMIVAPNNSVTNDNQINIRKSLFHQNIARNGGGLYINGNKGFGNSHLIEVNLENTTFSGNESQSDASGTGGGAIWSKCALWTSDGTTPNVTLSLVHCTFFDNQHGSSSNNGIRFTSDPANATTYFSAYNSIIASRDDPGEKSINFDNANTTDLVNCILGGTSNAPAILNESAKNNISGQTATFAGLKFTLSGQGGAVSMHPLVANSEAVDYCTSSTSISLPSVDARGFSRDSHPDAGAFEYLQTVVIGDFYRITSDLILDQMEITANGNVVIDSKATLTINNSIVNNGSLTVESGSALAILGTATGNATVKRNTTGNSGYSIIGPPVAGATITNLAADYLYVYNESDNSWTVPTGTLQTGKGYFVGYNAVDPEVVLTGQMIFGDKSVSITKSGDGFNLVANPYAAAISIADFLSNNTNGTSTTGAVYLWDDGGVNVGSKRGGDYITINNLGVTVSTNNLSDGVSGLQGQAAAESGYLASMQGFFVEAAQAGNVAFTSDMQVNTSFANIDENFYRKNLNTITDRVLKIKMTLSNGNARDELIIGLTRDGTFDFDYGLDAKKISQDESMSFFSILAGQKMSIQGLPLIGPEDESIVSLGVGSEHSGLYTFAVEDFDGFGDSIRVYLIDRQNGDRFLLRDGVELAFDFRDGYKQDRFGLIFRGAEVLATPIENRLHVYGNMTSLHVNYSGSGSHGTAIYSLSGKVLFEKIINYESGHAELQVPLNRNEIYILRVGNVAAKFILNE